MSEKVFKMVVEHFPDGFSSSDLLVFLMIADFSDDQGKNICPGMKNIAKKCRISFDQTRRIMKRLQENGFIHVTGNNLGGAGKSKIYEIDLKFLRSLEKKYEKKRV